MLFKLKNTQKTGAQYTDERSEATNVIVNQASIGGSAKTMAS